MRQTNCFSNRFVFLWKKSMIHQIYTSSWLQHILEANTYFKFKRSWIWWSSAYPAKAKLFQVVWSSFHIGWPVYTHCLEPEARNFNIWLEPPATILPSFLLLLFYQVDHFTFFLIFNVVASVNFCDNTIMGCGTKNLYELAVKKNKLFKSVFKGYHSTGMCCGWLHPKSRKVTALSWHKF